MVSGFEGLSWPHEKLAKLDEQWSIIIYINKSRICDVDICVSRSREVRIEITNVFCAKFFH
jgi:hypothetical protein